MLKGEANIKTLDEIVEAGIQYWFVDEASQRTGKWVKIEQDNYLDNEFVIRYRAYRHQLYGFVTKGNSVRTWKTFGGALRWAKQNLGILVRSE